jgi:hypothetical protein
MKATAASLVTPHVLRIIDLANSAQNGAKVDWHVRDTVAKSMGILGDQANAEELVAGYLEGLENSAAQAPKARTEYARTLQAAVDEARRLKRE